ncbi:amino acid adenylation domain-containing protein [Sciscionella sediminilitoris]|uniref:amino acid adenylation domain-containing protein n=1 Tax=Sciscionella sediminilitoris TaxID=1445613 RepID=UPI0012E3292C|nr:amino acid adenylation domain-containing protein [Sciscionella sp. SE31]
MTTTVRQRKTELLRRIGEWNRTRVEYPRDALVTELLERQAHRSPDAIALAPETGAPVSYARLWQRVERLAGALAARGVAAGDVVGVALERSVSGYVAILGALRAGAAFLPLDTNFPRTRLAEILADAEVSCVVTDDRFRDLLPDKVDVLHVDTAPGDRRPPEPAGVRAQDPAYVLYTSGSTGKPKGVLVPHRGITRLVCVSSPAAIESADVVCGTVNLTFDLAVWELFGALLNGAKLLVPSLETVLSSVALHRYLRAEQASVMWLGAALLHQHVAQDPAMFGSLRCLVAGGDALNPGAVRAILRNGAPGMLVDGYGPTENSVLCTAHVVTELEADAESVPIGRPLPNSTAYVLGDDGEPADIGAEGELWVGGDGVALGYLNRPELTGERFVPDPFAEREGAMLYRTGDMARWRADGVLEFLGRRDRQLKLSGFRVELREIELVLAAHPDVAEAVVTVESGERLRGWVVAGEGTDSAGLPVTLRGYLRDRLPVFMVPREITVVAEMPTTPSGKIDRERLTEQGDPETAGLGEEPSDPLERAVAAVWREVLGVREVGRTDDFFRLGGGSLQAAQVAAAIGNRLGIPAERGSSLIKALIGNPSLEQFSAQLTNTREQDGSTGAVDFPRESELPAGLRFDAPLPEDPCRPDRVLLTGATGFQGVFLLDRLVAAGVSTVYCLIRAEDEEHALRRLAGRMRRYRLDFDRVREHVVPVVGDMAEPELGLTVARFAELAESVEVIVHSGSLINFAYPYSMLRRTNVEGMRTLLRFATEGRRKPLHYLSSITTIVGFGTADVRYVREDAELEHAERISLGYPESKWVAERMAAAAGERGLPVAIYRPYEITGTRDTGVWNTDTLMCAWFRTIAETGLAPDVELPLDFVPVDYTAEAIVHILGTQRPDGRVYNLTNPRDARLSLLVERLRAMGYPVRTVPYTEWVRRVTELTGAQPQHPMTPFMPMFNEGANDTSITVKEMYFAETFPEFSRTNTELATRDAGIELPAVDAGLIDLYLRDFLESGFLTPPAGATEPEADPPVEQDRTHRIERSLQPAIADHVRANPAYRAVLEDRFDQGCIARFIASERRAQPVELETFAALAERCPRNGENPFHATHAAIAAATRPLDAAARAVSGASDAGGSAFTEFLGWLGAETGIGAAAAALRADLLLWCAVCGKLATRLRQTAAAPAEVLDYLGGYAEIPAELIRSCTTVIRAALEDGEDPEGMAEAIRRTETALGTYWDAVVSGRRPGNP